MTNEEAIDILQLMMNVRVPDELRAIRMAIDALREQEERKHE